MKTLLFVLSLSISGFAFSQFDWTIKPYVVVNDSLYENVKHPVFIMDSTLYIRTAEGVVLTFPSRDVNYISKRCIYDRITPQEQNRLSRSVATGSYLSLAGISGGIALIVNNLNKLAYINANPYYYYYSPAGLIFGVAYIIPSSIAIYHFIQRKRQMKMIIESKGLRFISN
ncbi:MAG: hypothetical protein WCH03_07700 [Flavobacteriia bacterium]